MGSRNTFLVLSFLIILLMTLVFAQPRVAGGQRAVLGQFKFVVALQMQTVPDENGPILSDCTGSILSGSWILTAAHCLVIHIMATEIMGLKNVTTTQVLAGDVDSGKAFKSHRTFGLMRYVSKYYPHPDAYDLAVAKIHASVLDEKDFMILFQKLAKYFGARFDIALLQLEKPFTFGGHIAAITLATDYGSVNNQLNCVVVGFGFTNSSPEELHLNYIPVTIGGKEYCKSVEPDVWFKGDYTVCVRGKEEFMNPCVGDSGGPVTCGEDGQKQVLYGVGSSGATRAVKDFCGKSKIITNKYIFPDKAAAWIARITGLKIASHPTDPAAPAAPAAPAGPAGPAGPASRGPFLAFETKLFALLVFKSYWDIINSLFKMTT